MYCNAVGAQTDLIFDGGSLYMNAEGEIIEKANSFEEALLLIDTNINSKENQSQVSALLWKYRSVVLESLTAWNSRRRPWRARNRQS